MGIVSTGVEVKVTGAPRLSHRRSSVSFIHAWLIVMRLEDNAEMFPNQVSTSGAHIDVLFPAMLAIDAFERRAASYVFEGTNIGSLSELANRAACDHGPGRHGISRAAIDFRIAQARCHITVEAQLTAVDQGQPYWEVPRPLPGFSLQADLPVAEGLALFPALEVEPKKRLIKAIDAIMAEAGV